MVVERRPQLRGLAVDCFTRHFVKHDGLLGILISREYAKATKHLLYNSEVSVIKSDGQWRIKFSVFRHKISEEGSLIVFALTEPKISKLLVYCGLDRTPKLRSETVDCLTGIPKLFVGSNVVNDPTVLKLLDRMADTLEELESPLCYLVQTLRPLNLKTFKCNRSELFDFTRVFGYHRLRKLSLRTADNQKSLPLVCSQIEESIEELVLEDMYGSNTELLDLEFLRFMPNLKRIYLFSRLNILVHRNNNVLIDHLACLSQRAAELPPNIEVVFDLDLMSIVSVTKMLATLKNFTVVKSPENDATAKFGYRKGQTTLSSTFGSTKFFIRFDS